MRARLVFWSVLVIAALSGCSADPKGEIVLAIDTDHAAGVDFDRFQIQISTSSSKDRYDNLVRELGQPGLLSFPATLGIVTNGDPSTSIHVRILTGKASADLTDVGVPRTLREVVTTVPENRVALLRVHVDWLCVGAVKPEPDRYVESECPEGLTCIAGACADWAIDARSLPDFDERNVFGGGSRRGDGACFDTSACFARGAMAEVRLEDCSVAAPRGASGANAALVLAPGEGGICAGGACLVPLTLGTPEGFSIERDRLKLPRAACDRLAEPIGVRKIVGVATTGACASKTPRTPTCGPWSPFRGTEATGGAPMGYTPEDAGVRDAESDAP